MKKGIDYTGITVAFYCHDGQGNYVLHKRGEGCRDEIGRWDFGGGGIKFGETIKDALCREVKEEYGIEPIEYEFLNYGEAVRKEDEETSHWISFDFKVLVDRDKVINGEPEKHTELQWFALDNLPTPLHSLVERDLVHYKDRL